MCAVLAKYAIIRLEYSDQGEADHNFLGNQYRNMCPSYRIQN